VYIYIYYIYYSYYLYSNFMVQLVTNHSLTSLNSAINDQVTNSIIGFFSDWLY
jgi:hypothetical protein